jgi:hypothetical protein
MRTTNRPLTLSALTLLAAAACAPTAQEDFVDGRVELPEAPAAGKGIQFQMPEFDVPAGEEIQVCWVPDWAPDQDYFVNEFLGLQSGMGHHVVAMLSTTPRDPGEVFDCTALESMTTLEPLLVPINPPGESEPDEDLRILPTDMMVRIPAEARIVIQSHYVNVADRPLRIADVARFTFIPENEQSDYIEAGYYVQNHGGIDVAEGEQSVSVSCTVDEDTQLVSLLGHMHDWGTAVKIERTRDGVTDLLYEITDWTVEFRDLPPITRFSSDEPLLLQAGDTLTTTCSYMNDTGENLRFPKEMCVAFGTYFPARQVGFISCN